MDAYLQFLLLGVGAGAIYAGLALGLVLAFQGSGVVNFAHGAIAMYAAYVYDTLRDQGDYVLPLIGLPARIHLAESVSTPIAMVLALATAAVLGLVLHVAVFHPLRARPLLAKIVASVGVMLVLQTVVVLRFGTANNIVGSALPRGGVDVIGVNVPGDRLWLAGIVGVVTVVLWAVFRFTRFGLATRGAAVQEKGAVLLGHAPSRLAAGNWVLASLTAGMVGVLAAPISGLNPSNYVLFVVPALAAALAGRLSSLLVTAAAGMALGMFESVISKIGTWESFPDWLPFTAAQRALPLVVIVALLFLRGRGLPGRGSLDAGHQARSLRPRRVGVTSLAGLVAGVAAVLLTSGTTRFHLYVSLASALVLLSIVLLTGFVGQVSLAQAVFAGAAGFGTAVLAERAVGFPFGPLLGALVATAAGLVMAVPALRIRGAQLAIVTMAAGIAIEEGIFRNPSVTGVAGALLVEPPTLFGLDLAANRPGDFNRVPYGILLVLVVVGVTAAVANLRRGVTGRRLLALRANERAAAASGIDVARTKLLAFALSSFVAGLGGAMLAYLRGGISADSFSVFISLTFLAFAYLGGIASVSGAIVGAALVPGGIVFGVLGGSSSGGGIAPYVPLFAGLALIVMAITTPEGITGRVDDLVRRRRAGAAA